MKVYARQVLNVQLDIVRNNEELDACKALLKKIAAISSKKWTDSWAVQAR